MQMIDFQEFIDRTLGCQIDTDGYPEEQPFQCVDLTKYYNDCYFSPFQVYCSDSGFAKDWANLKYSNGLLDYYDETAIDNMIKGTLVVWGECRVAPYSHIGFFVEDNGDGTFKCLQQNAPYPYVTLSNITYEGIIGAFIPKNVKRPSPTPIPVPTPTPEPTPPKPVLYQTIGDMYVRWDASYLAGVKLVKDLTEDGKAHATSTNPYAYAVYRAGTIFTVYEKKDMGYGLWGRSPSGWICLIGQSGRVYCEEYKD